MSLNRNFRLWGAKILEKARFESKKMDNNIRLSDRQIVVRVNELYHDLQAPEFNEVHARRHRVERAFWECQAYPAIIRGKVKVHV